MVPAGGALADTVVAASPLVVAVTVLLLLRRSAVVAGVLGCGLAMAVACFWPAFALSGAGLALAVLRGLLVTLLVAYVVFFGLLLYQLMARGQAMARLATRLAALGGDRAARTLLLCLPLGAFFEGASGFGVGIVIVAPLLLALGYAPSHAALLALLTQNAVPWGALAVGTLLGAELAGLAPTELGEGCAYLSLLLFPYFGALALWLGEGPRALRRHAGLLGLTSLLMVLAAWGGTRLFGVELAMVVGGVVVAGVLVSRLPGRTRPVPGVPAEDAPMPTTARAVAPYAALATGLLLSRLLPPLRDWLLTHAVLSVPAVAFALPLLYSPGFWLAVACAVAVVVLRLDRAAVVAELRQTARRWWLATLALAAFLVLAEVMLRAGMTARLAASAAAALGSAYLLAAPAVGGLAGFLTGSNAAGNAMLLPFQLQMAERLSVPPLVLAAVHNTTAADLSLASPQRVVLATAVVGLSGQEGLLLRRALPVGLGIVVLITVEEVAWLALLGRGTP
ncbi:MAG TPA: L-lactate permease [Chloroflexota bacterium]|nr:L-lactate permease [Chloroflexota bacterium]